MKHLVLTLICFLWGLGLNAQDISNNIGAPTEAIQEEQVEVITSNNDTSSLNLFTENSDFNYKNTKEWKKYKTLNTLGWCFTGIGAAGIGFSLYLFHGLKDSDINPNLAAGIVLGGTILVFSAITVPLFVIAHHYKETAIRNSQLSLSLSPVNTPGMGTFKPQQNLALGLRYTF